MKQFLLITSLIASTPLFAEPLNYQRIDFQTEVEKEIPNDLLTITLHDDFTIGFIEYASKIFNSFMQYCIIFLFIP